MTFMAKNDLNVSVNRFKTSMSFFAKKRKKTDKMFIQPTNLTELSRRGYLTELGCRESELYRMMEILLRKKKNNPLLVGEFGVGKSSIIRLFANRIANKQIPFFFFFFNVIYLDLSKYILGTKDRNEFEENIYNAINLILRKTKKNLFFIDNLDLLKIGDGISMYLLNYVLNKFQMRCIGTYTYIKIQIENKNEKEEANNKVVDDLNQKFLEDYRIKRYFQIMKISEASKKETLNILENIRPFLENFHNVEYTDSALLEALNLSYKHMTDQILPSKAIALIDHAGAREVLYIADNKQVSFFDSILAIGIKNLNFLKIEAFRRSDSAAQFVYTEIQNIYKNIFSKQYLQKPRKSKTGHFIVKLMEFFQKKNVFSKISKSIYTKNLKKCYNFFFEKISTVFFFDKKQTSIFLIDKKKKEIDLLLIEVFFFFCPFFAKKNIINNCYERLTNLEISCNLINLLNKLKLKVNLVSFINIFNQKNFKNKIFSLEKKIYEKLFRRIKEQSFTIQSFMINIQNFVYTLLTKHIIKNQLQNFVLNKKLFTASNYSIIKTIGDLFFSNNQPKFSLISNIFLKKLSDIKGTDNLEKIVLDLIVHIKKELYFKKKDIIIGNIKFSMYRSGLIFSYQKFNYVKLENYWKKKICKYLYHYKQIFNNFNNYIEKIIPFKNYKKSFYMFNNFILDFFGKDIENKLKNKTINKKFIKDQVLLQTIKKFPDILKDQYVNLVKFAHHNDIKKNFLLTKNGLTFTKNFLALKEHEKNILITTLEFFSNKYENNIKNGEEFISFFKKTKKYIDLNTKIRISTFEIKNLFTAITGISLQSFMSIDIEKLATLENDLHRRIIGQNEAISSLSNAIRRARLGVRFTSRPIGSFLFCGPTGVGKTELSKAINEILFGSEDDMIRFDMSEYMERFNISKLIGAPPGYVGFGTGGELTKAILEKPYSVVLFDEVEKAHEDIMTIFLQILEEGRLTDTGNNVVSFENAIVILTSNAASKEIQSILEEYQTDTTPEDEDCFVDEEIEFSDDDIRYGKIELVPQTIDTNFVLNIRENITNIFSNFYTNNKIYNKLSTTNYTINKSEFEQIEEDTETSDDIEPNFNVKEMIMDELSEHFLPEIINRFDEIIIFESLSFEDITQILEIMINQIKIGMSKHGVEVYVDNEVKSKILLEGYSKAFGARPLRRLVTKYIEIVVSNTLLNINTNTNAKKIYSVRISLTRKGNVVGYVVS